MGRTVSSVAWTPAHASACYRSKMRAGRLLVACALGALAGCSSPPEGDEPLSRSSEPLTAVCQANVKGIGLVDTETKYLPGVVHCENGGAPFEALKAQAVAARTYLYYKMETSGSIADGTSDQVYSCGSAPNALQIKAVEDTAGQVLRYKGVTICAFFVAGGAASPPGCVGSSAAATEKYVTYNAGKTGSGIDQTTLGWVSPTNNRNRGCLSQLGSRCLDGAGKKYGDILEFYYGADIVLETATGPCVPTGTPDAGADTTAPPDSGKADSGMAEATVDADDAASDSATDAAGDAADARPLADTGDVGGDLEGSCSCRTPGHASAERTSGAVAGLAFLAFAVLRRRR